MKKNLLQNVLTLVLCGWLGLTSFAQTATLTGRVTSVAGEALPGVSVLIKGTTTGTSTDANGSYTVTNLPSDATLVFSFIGFATQEIPVGNRTQFDLVLAEDTKMLNELVVTALGIKREEKSLGFAAQTIQSNAVVDAKTNNWVNSLSGKVAGLNIQGVGAGPMGSSRITLRGESSLNLDNNQALIVLDGVPISRRITGTGFTSHLSADSPVDYGSTLSDLNPDDIESVTVLKGAGATALYGSRAAGGALIITTKVGNRKGKGIGVTVNSNFNVEQINRWPDYQFDFGEGRAPTYYSYLDSPDGPNTSMDAAAGRAWGPRFNGQNYFQYNPAAPDGRPTERTPWVPHRDYISGFFQTGRTFSNSLSIEGGGDNGSARLSITHLKNDWIIPNTGFERLNAALSVSQKISNRLKINGKANYTNKRSDNLPIAGYNNQSLMYFVILGTAPNIRPEWFQPYWQPGREQVAQRSPFNPGPDNPYLGMYEMLNKMNKHGLIGTVSANYELSSKFDLMVRTGLDMSYEYRSQQRPFSMTRYPRGMFREQYVFSYESNSDFLLTYKDNFFGKFSVTASAGGNAMRQIYDLAAMNADQLSRPGVYQISNSLDQAVAEPFKSRKAINSFYGTAQFAYDERIFVDITGRNDWSSTLPAQNNSYFYPSVSSSFLLNELLPLPQQISFAKVRASWAQVGNDTEPYQTARYFDRIYGNGFTNPTRLFNAELKPEITTSTELGLDVRLFKNRLGLDVAYYNNNSRNQIVTIPFDPTAGFSTKVINAGLINSRGMEVKLTGKPVDNPNFKWNVTLLWSRNRSYVRELSDGLTNYIISAHNTNVTVEARVGGLMGDLYGRGFQRAPDGQVIYQTNGLPAPLDPMVQHWGNAFADWKGSIQNEFTIRNVRVSILLDGQYGGSMYSQTNHKNNTLGKTVVTLPGREEGVLGQGVVRQTDGTFTPNTIRAAASAYYDNYYQIANAETNIFDASFLKIREMRVEFNLPPRLLSRLGVQRTSVALFGRDLFNFTRFPGFDSEGGNLNSGTLTPGVELAQFPSARTMGVNLTLKF